MNICFFLDARPLEGLMGQENQLKIICAKLDSGRRKKLLEHMECASGKLSQDKALRDKALQNQVLLRKTLPGKAMAEKVGAGLLLQYAVAYVTGQNQMHGTMTGQDRICEIPTGQDGMPGTLTVEAASPIMAVTCEQLLADRTPAIPLEFCYGDKGKPYLANMPLFFSLSHSAGRVICAVSDEEIGADMQYPRELNEEKTVKRFFSAEEVKVWHELEGSERTEFFYQCWTAKEAYGKLTGEGVAAYLGKNVRDSAADQLVWQELVYDGGYVAICQRAGDENKGAMERS